MHMQRPFLRLILCSDTRPTKFALFLGALFWAIGLMLPGDTMTRPSFIYMGTLASENVWCSLWSVYAVGMLFYTFRRVPNAFAYMLNALGLALWSIYSLAILVQIPWPWPAGLAADGAMFFAAFWLMIRTGGDGGDRRGD
jgi:hypothetical protein